MLGEDIDKLLPRGAPGRVAGQAVAAVHTLRCRGHRAPDWLPGRVVLLFKSQPLTQPWLGLAARASTGRRPRPRALPRPYREPRAHGGHWCTTCALRPPTQPGPTARRAALAPRIGHDGSQVRWIALQTLCRPLRNGAARSLSLMPSAADTRFWISGWFALPRRAAPPAAAS